MTELTKALASYFFGSEEAMIRPDMSEFMERHTVSKLIGSSRCVGFNEGGQLTEPCAAGPPWCRRNRESPPRCVQPAAAAAGRRSLTDLKGHSGLQADLIIMTSNIGSKVIEKGGGGLGFEFSGDDAEETQYNRIRSLVKKSWCTSVLSSSTASTRSSSSASSTVMR